MPEGHTIHRAARDHQRILAGRSLRVSSPQGRFAAGADHLDGRACLDVEAYGKHLVYQFDGESYLHVHLGLFGRIKKRKLPAPEPVGAVRVRLEGDTHLVDINGPAICETLDGDGFQALTGRIGPDVLREDADAVFPRYRDEVTASPDDWRAWYRLGLAYDASGDRRRAREAVRRAITLGADSRR